MSKEIAAAKEIAILAFSSHYEETSTGKSCNITDACYAIAEAIERLASAVENIAEKETR